MTSNEYYISTDKSKLDRTTIINFLKNESYWAKNISEKTVNMAIDNSLNFGLFHEDIMFGYARIVTDFSTIAYITDVFILESYRGKGLSKWLIQEVMNNLKQYHFRRIFLFTADAHGLYEKFGFMKSQNPERYLEILDNNAYTKDDE